MGDHRASIKITAEMHGIKRETDMWINYYPHNDDNVDNRIINFFISWYEEAMAAYEKHHTIDCEEGDGI
jgi:hypothetical protein